MPDKIETEVIRCLTFALDNLMNAKSKTKIGFVNDHCDNAIDEIIKAIKQANCVVSE